MARLFLVTWFTFPVEEPIIGRRVFRQGTVRVKTENGRWPAEHDCTVAVFDDMAARKIDFSLHSPVISLPVPVSEADADAYLCDATDE
jgi:hypothetical protein